MECQERENEKVAAEENNYQRPEKKNRRSYDS